MTAWTTRAFDSLPPGMTALPQGLAVEGGDGRGGVAGETSRAPAVGASDEPNGQAARDLLGERLRVLMGKGPGQGVDGRDPQGPLHTRHPLDAGAVGDGVVVEPLTSSFAGEDAPGRRDREDDRETALGPPLNPVVFDAAE
jgi:hypothetical protein